MISSAVPGAVGSVEVTGDLNIKGITHEVTLPVNMEVGDHTAIANGELKIDRTQWDIRYRSGRFFDNLADNAIADSIEFDLKIVAKK